MSPFTRPQLDSKLQIPQMPPSFTLQALGFSTRSVLLKPSFQNSATADGCSYFQKLEVYLGLLAQSSHGLSGVVIFAWQILDSSELTQKKPRQSRI